MKTVLIFLFISVMLSTNAQIAVVSNDREGYKLYMGIDNPVSVSMGNAACTDLVISTTNGKIMYTGNCRYLLNPVHKGKLSLSITQYTGSQKGKTSVIEFTVLPLPKPVAKVGQFNSTDTVQVNAFKAQGGVTALPSCCGSDMKYTVYAYSVSVLDNNKPVFNATVNGNMFTPSIKTAFTQLKPGQQVLIYGISAVGADQQKFTLNPLEFFLK